MFTRANASLRTGLKPRGQPDEMTRRVWPLFTCQRADRGCSAGPPGGLRGHWLCFSTIPCMRSQIYIAVSVSSFEATYSQASILHVRVLYLSRPRCVEAFILKQWYDKPLLSQVEIKITFQLTDIIRVIHGTIPLGFICRSSFATVYIFSLKRGPMVIHRKGRNLPFYLLSLFKFY